MSGSKSNRDDLDLWLCAVERARVLGPETACVGAFGTIDDVELGYSQRDRTSVYSFRSVEFLQSVLLSTLWLQNGTRRQEKIYNEAVWYLIVIKRKLAY